MVAGDEAIERTVVVGVKLDRDSREMLTWALVKVAEPGDTVIALHIIDNNEIVGRDGKSSLLSLVKAFDSVLAMYESFCNLKQVDLKLKICRGSSIRRILVREAKSYSATKVIVGTSRNKSTIWLSASVAKYCAKKLSRACWVLAVNNGKVVFQREGAPVKKARRGNGLINVIQRSISLNKSSRVLTNGGIITTHKSNKDNGTFGNLQTPLVKNHSCFVCGYSESKSLAIVPATKVEANSGVLSMSKRQLPDVGPGWPLLRSSASSNQQGSNRFLTRQISVVQWALRLPSRQLSSRFNADQKQICGSQRTNLDGENGAIVSVGTELPTTILLTPDSSSKILPKELEYLCEKYSGSCKLFEYQELLDATSNFLEDNLIGRGGSSMVYRGCLPGGKELAVKILKSSEDVLKEFILEIEIITTLHHKNTISLLGFCFEDNNLLLVYDFLPRGSLEENLHGKKKDSLEFCWSDRYKVALGIAEALEYLHGRSEEPVIHRDVKSSNILLSDDFEPQLSDFGLAKWAPTSSTFITCTDVAGTFGYLAPEYFMYGKVNDKIDVYAFGVVLLELLSGRKPISNDHPKGQESLVIWAKPILNVGKVTELLDTSLGNNYDREQMESMILAATLCIRRSPQARPEMSFVLKLLQGDRGVTNWARMQVNEKKVSNMMDDDVCLRSKLQSHLNVALLDMEDDSVSISSVDQNISLEEYLQGRWSRSSSFD